MKKSNAAIIVVIGKNIFPSIEPNVFANRSMPDAELPALTIPLTYLLNDLNQPASLSKNLNTGLRTFDAPFFTVSINPLIFLTIVNSLEELCHFLKNQKMP